MTEEVKNSTNSTQNTTENAEEQKKEQERTTRNKIAFLEVFEKSMGIVKVACDAIRIDRKTYYNWIDSDPEFKKETEMILRKQRGEVEDRLLKAIAQDKLPAITFYLNRKHPDYKPVSKTEVVVGEKTFEDIIKEQEEKVRKDQEEWDQKYGNKKPDTATTGGSDEQIDNTGNVIDKRQEGEKDELQVKPGTEVLLGEKNQEEHNTESAPKGDNKDN